MRAKMREVVAHHEAGHAVVAIARNIEFDYAAVCSDSEKLGEVTLKWKARGPASMLACAIARRSRTVCSWSLPGAKLKTWQKAKAAAQKNVVPIRRQSKRKLATA